MYFNFKCLFNKFFIAVLLIYVLNSCIDEKRIFTHNNYKPQKIFVSKKVPYTVAIKLGKSFNNKNEVEYIDKEKGIFIGFLGIPFFYNRLNTIEYRNMSYYFFKMIMNEIFDKVIDYKKNMNSDIDYIIQLDTENIFCRGNDRIILIIPILFMDAKIEFKFKLSIFNPTDIKKPLLEVFNEVKLKSKMEFCLGNDEPIDLLSNFYNCFRSIKDKFEIQLLENNVDKEFASRIFKRKVLSGNESVDDVINALTTYSSSIHNNPYIHSLIIPTIIQLLGSEHTKIRIKSIRILKDIGLVFHDELIPFISEALNDNDKNVRIEAIKSLSEIGSTNIEIRKKIIPYIVNMLQDESSEVCSQTILHLSTYKYHNKIILDKLSDIAKFNKNSALKIEAKNALKKIKLFKMAHNYNPDKHNIVLKKNSNKNNDFDNTNSNFFSESEKKIFTKKVGKYYALIVGISKYQDPKISNIQYASKDAQSIYNWIVSPIGGNYLQSNVKLLIDEDATKENLMESLRIWLKSSNEEDFVLLYFACHGTSDTIGSYNNLYLLPYNANYHKISTTGFPMWEIEIAIKRFIKSKKIVIIADTCHSAGIGEDFEFNVRANRGVYINPIINKLQKISEIRDSICIICATDKDQLSRESDKWGGGHGVFTYYLLKGLKGQADFDHNSIVGLSELITFTSEKVRMETNNKQCPVISGKFDPILSIKNLNR